MDHPHRADPAAAARPRAVYRLDEVRPLLPPVQDLPDPAASDAALPAAELETTPLHTLPAFTGAGPASVSMTRLEPDRFAPCGDRTGYFVDG